MEKKVVVKISTVRTSAGEEALTELLGGSEDGVLICDNRDDDICNTDITADGDIDIKTDNGDDTERIETITDGILREENGHISVEYEETELTGMEGSRTSVVFNRADPGLISMIRCGSINTTLTFEAHKRHICSYDTIFTRFEVCVHTISTQNNLPEGNELKLDYIIEIHGAHAERCILTMTVNDAEN